MRKLFRKSAGRLLKTTVNQQKPFDFGTATVIQQNTTNTNALGADGYSWAQSYQPVVDSFGKIATMVQKNGTGLYWLFGNSITSWTDVLSTPGDSVYPVPVTRHAMAYDSINDKFHVLYLGVDPTDGMIYRRYAITRDANNNITGVTKDANTNIQFDITNGGTMAYNHPVILFFDDIGSKGAVVCIWAAINSGGGGGMEIRGTMRVLTNDSADGTIGNWTHLGINSSTSIGNAPQCAYTALAASATNAGGHPAILRKRANSHIKDLHIFWDESVSGTRKWRTRRAVWAAGSSNWTSLSTAVDVGNLVESGSDSGYNLKGEISSKPVEDTKNDLIFFAYSAWKSNTDGDAWLFKSVDTNDAVSSATYVYFKNAAANNTAIFITGDLMFDRKSKLLIVTYTDLPNKDTYIAAYKKTASGMVQVKVPKRIFSSSPADIPVLLGSRLNNKFSVIMRNFNAAAVNNPPTYTAPYTGYFITVKQK